jgi:hypothetical protein
MNSEQIKVLPKYLCNPSGHVVSHRCCEVLKVGRIKNRQEGSKTVTDDGQLSTPV